MRVLLVTLLLAGCRAERTNETAPPPSGNLPAPASTHVAAPGASSHHQRAPLDADDCIAVDEGNLSGSDVTLEGKIASAQHSHPNGSTFTFYTLRLAAPRCVRGSSDTMSIDEVQLAPSSDVIRVETLVGRHVRIKGSAFPWHTAWHVRPVLVGFDAIETLP
jgi:hypothetical protein